MAYDPTKKVKRTSTDTMANVDSSSLAGFNELLHKKRAVVPTVGCDSDEVELVWDWSEASRKNQMVVLYMKGKCKHGDKVILEAQVPVQGLEHYLRMT